MALEKRNFVINAHLGRVLVRLQGWRLALNYDNIDGRWLNRVSENEGSDNFWHLFVATLRWLLQLTLIRKNTASALAIDSRWGAAALR